MDRHLHIAFLIFQVKTKNVRRLKFKIKCDKTQCQNYDNLNEILAV